ncbi:MAG: class I SAM-dependent methyltransferase [Solirubrobacterales bacterium]
MSSASSQQTKPGYKRLWWHSYRLGLGWILRAARRGWPGRKAGLQRLLVPMDPWRYYEMGKLADERYEGDWLDVSSPKLLTSLLQREDNGNWVGTDLFAAELEAWSVIDPKLTLQVEDATDPSFGDDRFDGALCVSVLEHIGPGKDLIALEQMRRVVKPGGVLHLTTMVSAEARDVYVDHLIYGEASDKDERGVFFEHVYAPDELNALVEQAGWTITDVEYAVQTRPGIQARFYSLAPFSYVFGGLLRFWFPRTIDVDSSDNSIRRLDGESSGVAYLRLVNPATSS